MPPNIVRRSTMGRPVVAVVAVVTVDFGISGSFHAPCSSLSIPSSRLKGLLMPSMARTAYQFFNAP